MEKFNNLCEEVLSEGGKIIWYEMGYFSKKYDFQADGESGGIKVLHKGTGEVAGIFDDLKALVKLVEKGMK